MVGKSTVEAFHEIERTRQERGSVPPVSRLGVVVAFLLTVVSFGKYDLASLSALALYPVSLVCFERIPLFSAFRRYWFLLLPVLLLGAANPFFDRAPAASIGGIAVSGGWLSFAVLALKGMLSFAVGWSLLRKMGVEGLAEAFAALRLPPSFGLSVLLMHRYLVLMIKEMNRMRDAYALRSGTLGRAIRPLSWGPFVGLLLMRSMDRATCVQAALELRGGGNGVLRLAAAETRNRRSIAVGVAYFIGWGSFFVAVRFLEPMLYLGQLIQGLLPAITMPDKTCLIDFSDFLSVACLGKCDLSLLSFVF